MRILIANLKHLYQRRGMWLVYLFLGLFALAVVDDVFDRSKAGDGERFKVAVLAIGAGYMVATMLIEVLTKPFSYCLPGHRRVLRKYIFIVAVPVSYLCSMLFIAYPGLDSWQLHLVFCSAFFAQLIFYLCGIFLLFVINKFEWAAFVFMVIAMIGVSRFDLHVILERAIVGYPYAIICVGGLSGVVLWIWLGRAGLARRYCNIPMMSIFDSCNREKLHKYKVAKRMQKLKDHPRPWVERFFLGRMDKCEYFGAGRYVWGVLYNHFAMIFSKWKMFAVGLVSLTIVCGYMIHWIVAPLIIVPVAIFGHQRPSVYSSMLTFGGRRERFVSTAVLCLAGIAVACAAVLIMAGLSGLLAGIMPEIALKGGARKLVFRIIDARFVFIPLVVAPFVLTMRLVFYRKPVYMTVLLMLLFALMIVGRESIKAIITSRGCVAGIGVVGWAIFFLVLGYICEKRCLVGQGRSG